MNAYHVYHEQYHDRNLSCKMVMFSPNIIDDIHIKWFYDEVSPYPRYCSHHVYMYSISYLPIHVA